MNDISVWPTKPVELNHLEAMAILMLIVKQQEDGGLSEPEASAQKKIEVVGAALLAQIGMGR